MESSQTQTHWNTWQHEHAHSEQRWHDWGDHPLILGCIQRQLFGDPARTVFDFLKQDYPDFANANALSLCCGDGAFEELLVSQHIFAQVTGLDLAGARIEAAQSRATNYPDRLAYTVGDVNCGEFGEACYGVVFAKAALHHVQELEALFSGIRRCLRPGGALVTIDFFGPTRFQWPDVQVEQAERLLLDLPAELRRRGDGSIKTSIDRPTVAQMIAVDPSEAVRSAELGGFISKNFPTRREFAIGGTLMHLVFTPDILNNFEPDDPQHKTLVEQAFEAERALLEDGVIESDFRFVIATF